MKRVDGRINEKVRRICRSMYNRAGDRKKLQTLLVRLQELLRQEVARQRAPRKGERYEPRVAAKMTSQLEDPFDKIMVV